MIYKTTGNLRAIQALLGHTKIENTIRYLGVDIEDAVELAERTELKKGGGTARRGATLDSCLSLSKGSIRFALSLQSLVKWFTVQLPSD